MVLSLKSKSLNTFWRHLLSGDTLYENTSLSRIEMNAAVVPVEDDKLEGLDRSPPFLVPSGKYT